MRIIAIWNKELKTVPSDTHIDQWLEIILNVFNQIKKRQEVIEYKIEICSNLQVYALRTLVKDNKIEPDDLIFLFDDIKIKVDKHGRLDYWPEGFADRSDDFMLKLM